MKYPKEGDAVCASCDKKFHFFQKGHNPPPATCSKKCAYLLRGRVQKKRMTRICAACQKTFEITPAWLRKSGNRGIYCSRSCRWSSPMKYTNKQKIRAQNKMNFAIVSGELVRKPCIICGNPETQGHHHKGYADSVALDVVWLCFTHHNQEHERLRRLGLTQYL